MKLDGLIRKCFTDSEKLARHLAKFAGQPAVFSPDPPEDNVPGWNGQAHYPRLVFNFDLQANTERNSAGTLSVSLLCQNTGDIFPEQIEPEIRECLRDVILKPDGNSPYAFAWAGTEAFDIPDENTKLLIGCDVRFDILEYAPQETTDPDPVLAINRYVKRLYPKCIAIGLDRMEEITVASKDTPVIYIRLISVEKAEETNTVAWMDGRIAVHILCPDTETRVKMAAAIADKMSLAGEIIMEDKSPMFIQRLQADYKSDYMKNGLVFVTGHYGLPRYRAKPHGMKKINLIINKEVLFDGSKK